MWRDRWHPVFHSFLSFVHLSLHTGDLLFRASPIPPSFRDCTLNGRKGRCASRCFCNYASLTDLQANYFAVCCLLKSIGVLRATRSDPALRAADKISGVNSDELNVDPPPDLPQLYLRKITLYAEWRTNPTRLIRWDITSLSRYGIATYGGWLAVSRSVSLIYVAYNHNWVCWKT